MTNIVNGQCQCPVGMKDNGSACVSICTSTQQWQPTISKCCRSDQVVINGQCACQTGMHDTGSSCVAPCTSAQTWVPSLNTCCRSDMTTVSNGKCACAPGKMDNGNACVNMCTSQQTYVPSSNTCQALCATGYTFIPSKSCQNGQGLCCKQGATPCKTICCPQGQDEVATGVCCNIGAVYTNGKCVTPSGAPKSRKRDQVPVAAPGSDAALCPSGLNACPIPGASAGQYECLDALNDLQSCGGCASLGKGQDCTAIPGARFMGCQAGKCAVYSCKRGWKNVNGTSCVRA